MEVLALYVLREEGTCGRGWCCVRKARFVICGAAYRNGPSLRTDGTTITITITITITTTITITITIILLRGTIVNRTYGIHKKLYV